MHNRHNCAPYFCRVRAPLRTLLLYASFFAILQMFRNTYKAT